MPKGSENCNLNTDNTCYKVCAGNRSNIYGYTCTRIQVLYLIDIYTSKNEFYQHN